MTTGSVRERDLPPILADVATAPYPDYIDAVLATTAQRRQRPGWTFPERWLPRDMATRASGAQRRTPAVQLVVLLVILALAVAAGAILYAGFQRSELPPPFGPAGNGLLLVRVDDPGRGFDGDIVAIDPETGSVTTVIEGPTQGGPVFSNDGRRFLFVRDGSLLVANPDGSGVRELIDDFDAYFGWSLTGDRVLIWSGIEGDRDRPWIILSVDTGETSTSLDPGIPYDSAYWRPNSEQLVLRASLDTDPAGQAQGLYLVNADGTGLRTIGEWPFRTYRVLLSPDGSKLAFWEQGTDNVGHPHVVDIETGLDRQLDFSGDPVQFSPDSTMLLVYGTELAIIPVDGVGPAIPIGPEGMCCFEMAMLSPDGSKVLAQFSEGVDLADLSTWLLEVDGGEAKRLADVPNALISLDPRQWQRLGE